MIACSPKAVSPLEYAVEETDGRDDVDWVGVVLRGLENNFGHRQLFNNFLGSVLKALFLLGVRAARCCLWTSCQRYVDHMTQAVVGLA